MMIHLFKGFERGTVVPQEADQFSSAMTSLNFALVFTLCRAEAVFVCPCMRPRAPIREPATWRGLDKDEQ